MNTGGQESFRSGFVAIVGRPNMGKSTFLNRVLGQKVAIVSPKPQTTRTRILGAHSADGVQIVFLDTPGIHKAGKNLLNKAMVQTAMQSCQEVDALLYFVDAERGLVDADLEIIEQLPRGDAPIYLIVNKVDLVDAEKLLPLLQRAGEKAFPFAEVIPLSAQRGDNVDHLVGLLEKAMPEGPRYFPEEMVTDQPERFIAAEIVREKLFLNLQQELPYAMAVQVESYEEAENGTLFFHALILVHRDSHKAMVIGKKGAMLKKVGSAARFELERLLGTKAVVKLWVKVKKDWMDNRQMLQELGYPDELSS
uniref:GTPase Era n=1 Tax=Magnetococcus massalia (strain MO-1) TaxID=451514 RepID=A0A1S7LF17_MAGMO|nr:GTP-binding protein era [Candidatus Magnetococcus massalia]